MATAAQICALAMQDAKCPAYTAQAGQLLNFILEELCQTYDFDIARGIITFNLATDNGSGNGSGPYNLPADYLRADAEDVFFTLLGVKYVLIPLDISEYDGLVQQAGIANYPDSYATDLSQSPPQIYVWPPSSGGYPLTIRYRRQMPDIVNPETSTVTPWFPSASYLRTRLAGELMKITDDTRVEQFLGDGPMGAQGILGRYLQLTNDHSDRSYQVKLDRRNFGNSFNRLNNTKKIGW